jgi:hypothetical protein
MIKIASVALCAALGVAGLTQSVPAEARPYVSVGVGVPIVAPLPFAPVYYRPYVYAYRPYGRPAYAYGRYYRHWRRW